MCKVSLCKTSFCICVQSLFCVKASVHDVQVSVCKNSCMPKPLHARASVCKGTMDICQLTYVNYHSSSSSSSNHHHRIIIIESSSSNHHHHRIIIIESPSSNHHHRIITITIIIIIIITIFIIIIDETSS